MRSEIESYTGRARVRKTSKSVAIANVTARALITIGGVGTIISVLLVCVFLIYVATPLFLPGSISDSKSVAVEGETALASNQIVKLGVDEYQNVVWTLDDQMVVRAVSLADGHVIEDRPLLEASEDLRITTIGFSPADDRFVVGLSNGNVQLGRIGFVTDFLERDEVPESLRDLKIGTAATLDRTVIERTPEGQYRRQSLSISFEESMPLQETGAITHVDFVEGSAGPVIAAVGDDGVLRFVEQRQRENMLTGETISTYIRGEIAINAYSSAGLPTWMLLSGLGDSACLVWDDGRVERYDSRLFNNIQLAEERNFMEGADDSSASITSISHLLGKRTILVGTSNGEVSAWFASKPEDASTIDGRVLFRAHEFHDHFEPVTALTSSARSRMIATGYEDGFMEIRYVTSNKQIIAVETQDAQPILSVTIAPKEDAVLAVSKEAVYQWTFDPGYPEATLAALFTPVWYEGAPEPAHIWQSSSGTDDFEPKFGLIPLVFGTLKATFYAMLFGVPIAILAAIYTSEFLRPRVRALIKPIVELMASLPSVVLGFIAANIVAPFVEDFVPAMLCLFIIVPLSFLVCAYLWQLIPYRAWLRLIPFRLAAIVIVFPVSLVLSIVIGPVLEAMFFAGNIRIWLTGSIGSGAPAWMFILLPLSAVLAALATSRYVNPKIRLAASNWTRPKGAVVEVIRFAITFAVMLGIAGLASFILNDGFGWDPRGSFIGTYEQRNALIVGFIMGFAIIPIIYTIADDALTAVPEHLRSASLGTGATPWQTAIRIIVPTAMSGLFSACMIGLGRAVGETMIVLMAAGNTPVLDMNMFNGMRTLSANIAVELPEAVRNSTHYRTLFLAALVLFAMTFVINTVAETVRIRFRKRAFEL